MKILVPTDFSELSKVATLYAAGLAKTFNAELTLIHVVSLRGSVSIRVNLKEKPILTEMEKDAETQIQVLADTIKETFPSLQVTSAIVKGFPIQEVVTNYAHYNDTDLIVMGTKGANMLSPALMGSNTAATINRSTIPIISVPEFAEYREIKNIVYATDLKEVEHEVSLLIPFARTYNAVIDIIYVLSPGSKKKIDRSKIEKEIIIKSHYSKIRLHVILNDSLTEGISEFLTKEKPGLLAMYTQERGLFDGLFNKSVTKKMSFHSRVPLLAIKKESHLLIE